MKKSIAARLIVSFVNVLLVSQGIFSVEAQGEGVGPAWSIGAVDFQTGRADPAIREEAPSISAMGGLVHIRIDNNGSSALVIKDVIVNGVSAEELMKQRKVFWWRQRPERIAPGECGGIEFCADAGVLPQGGPAPQLTLVDADGGKAQVIWPGNMSRCLADKRLSMGYVFREGDTLRMFVRNDEPWSRFNIKGLAVNGRQQRAEIVPQALLPGQCGLITVRGFTDVPVRGTAVLELLATGVSGLNESVVRVRTIVDPRFPIGVWQSESRFQSDEQYRRQMAEAGIDCIFGRADQISAEPQRWMDELLGKHGYVPLVIGEPWLGPPEKPELKPAVAEFFEKYGASDRFIAWDAAEEPEWGKPPSGHSASYVSMMRAELVRRHAPRHPIMGTLCRSRCYYEYAPIFDVPAMDAYRVGAPSADTPPFLWGNYLESVASYTKYLKLNAEPSPVWVWAQGIHGWDQRAFLTDCIGNPIPTGSEIKAQLYMQLGEGAKGVLWFRLVPKDAWIENYIKEVKKQAEKVPLFGTRYGKNFLAQRIKRWGQYWDDAWRTMQESNLELRMLRPILCRADSYPQAWLREAGERKQVYVGAVAGLDAVVVFIVNLDYKFHGEGYQFNAQKFVSVGVERPAWQPEIEAAWTLKGDKLSPLEIQRRGSSVIFELRDVADGIIVVLGPKDLDKKLTTKTKSLLP